MPRKPKSFALPWTNLDIHNFQHQYTSTILLQLALSITLSNSNVPVPWRCITSGYWTGKLKHNSNFIISPVRKTWVIILLNTSPPTFTNMYGRTMCILIHSRHSSHGLWSLAFRKDVLKSLGTHMPRSPHYHVLGPPLICLSPQAPSIPSHQILGQLPLLNRLALPYTLSKRVPLE